MKLKDILSPSFRTFRKPRRPMVVVDSSSDWCRKMVSDGLLTEAQMQHACERYRLGKSRSGKTIFWMLDELGRVLDGHLGDEWVTCLLKKREPELLRNMQTMHCLFGQHLLNLDPDESSDEGIRPVCIVGTEPSAVLLSELLPEGLWMATVYPSNLNILTFEALRNRDVVLFPRADPVGSYYLAAVELADQAKRKYHMNVTVNTLLDQQASEEQKKREIDLADYLIENNT